MQRLLMAVMTLVLFTGAVAADDFWTQLTPEERAAAGLEALTPAQQAALDQLAKRYAKEGARQAVETAQTEVKKEMKQQGEARFGLTTAKPGPSVDTVRTRITGEFRGWNGKTYFGLDNGQVWAQADSRDVYIMPVQPGPEVELRVSVLGGWKLFILPSEQWVRVKRVH